MRIRLRWPSIAGVALVTSACAGPTSGGLFKPGAGGADATVSGVDNAGGSSCDSAGAGGADNGCSPGGVSGGGALGVSGGGSSGASTSGAGGTVAGGAGVAATSAGGGSGGAIGAGATNGGAGGGAGAGNGTGGVLSKCELLLLQANAQLQGAQTCSTASGEAFCTGYTNNECNCKVPVNNADSVATENYVQARDAFKKECAASCPTPCMEPKSQSCQLVFGLVVGSCVAM